MLEKYCTMPRDSMHIDACCYVAIGGEGGEMRRGRLLRYLSIFILIPPIDISIHNNTI